MSSQPRVNFNFAGQPGSVQPIQTTNQQTNFVLDNKYSAPRTYSTMNQYQVNRNVDQALVGVATGQRQIVTQTRYIEPQKYQETQVHNNNKYEPTQYRQTSQFVQSGQPDFYAEGSKISYNQVDRPHYNKIYNSDYNQRDYVIKDVDPQIKSTCCSPICWALWGLLGLAALILGLLFGLGVIGGWKGIDLDANLNTPNLNLQGPNLNANLNVQGPQVNVNGTVPNLNANLPNSNIDVSAPSVDINGNVNGGVDGEINPEYTVVTSTTTLNNGEVQANGTVPTTTVQNQQDWNTSFMYPPNWSQSINQPTTAQVSTQPIAIPLDTQSHPSVAVDQSLGNTSFMYPPEQTAHKLQKLRNFINQDRNNEKATKNK